jgi:hypothetical protein
MENRPLILIKAAMHYGLFFGPALIICHLLFYMLADIQTSGFLDIIGLLFLFSFVPVVSGIIICMKFFRDREFKGVMSYADGLRYGTLLMVFAGLLFAGYQMVFKKWVAPDYDTEMLVAMQTKGVEMLKATGQPEEEVKKFNDNMEAMKTPPDQSAQMFAPIMSIPTYAMGGLIISLVVAAIMRRKPQEGPEKLS